MSDKCKFEINFSSPKGTFTAEISLERARMQFGLLTYGNPAVCVWNEGQDPTWDHWHDPNNSLGNETDPVRKIFEYIGLYPPTIFTRALQSLWQAWRNSVINDQEAEQELEVLFKWLDHVYKSMPSTKFWRNAIG